MFSLRGVKHCAIEQHLCFSKVVLSTVAVYQKNCINVRTPHPESPNSQFRTFSNLPELHLRHLLAPPFVRTRRLHYYTFIDVRAWGSERSHRQGSTQVELTHSADNFFPANGNFCFSKSGSMCTHCLCIDSRNSKQINTHRCLK